MNLNYDLFLNFLNINNIELFDYQKRIAFNNFVNLNNNNYNSLFNCNLNKDIKKNIVYDLINNNDSSLKYYFSK
jgi:hypothetical protein